MSSGCSCTSCSCASKTPNVNGTEITVLSGLGDASNARSNDGDNSTSQTGTYIVLGTALILAGLAYFKLER